MLKQESYAFVTGLKCVPVLFISVTQSPDSDGLCCKKQPSNLRGLKAKVSKNRMFSLICGH
jgi:hypothetical protein